MIELIKATAWEMTPQNLFGPFHLTYMIIGFTLCFLLAFLLRHQSEQSEKRMFLIIGICLIISEVYKQLFWYYAIGYKEYPWICLPFHLCSIPEYIIPVLPFLKNEKIKNALYNFLGSFCFVGGLFSVVGDGGLLREYWTMTIHCLTWHLVLVFIGIYLGVRGKISRSYKGYLGACIVFYSFAAAAFCMNCALWNISNGNCDMFFVGPAPINIIVYSDIERITGRPIVTIIYLATLTFISFVFWVILSRLKQNKVKDNRVLNQN